MFGTFVHVIVLADLVYSRVWNYETDCGGIPGNSSLSTMFENGNILNQTLSRLNNGDSLVIPNNTYHLVGGIHATRLINVTIILDGTLVYSDDVNSWPRKGAGLKSQVLDCFTISNSTQITFTSTGMGTMDGNGSAWWGIPGIGYLVRGENRPKLIVIDGCKDVLFEHILLRDSPYWTFYAPRSDGLEVRNSHIDARRRKIDPNDTGHDVIDMTAFNTDGFDVTGKNVWIHGECFSVQIVPCSTPFDRLLAQALI